LIVEEIKEEEISLMVELEEDINNQDSDWKKQVGFKKD